MDTVKKVMVALAFSEYAEGTFKFAAQFAAVLLFVGISGVQPLVKRMLQKEDIPVIIQADQASQSGLLVRVIDEAKLGGATKVSVATSPTRG